MRLAKKHVDCFYFGYIAHNVMGSKTNIIDKRKEKSKKKNVDKEYQ